MKSKLQHICNNTVFTFDVNQREETKHGTDAFPCASYVDTYYNSFFPWHWHDEIELAYVESGSVIVSVNDQKYVVKQGEGIFINAGVLHGFTGIKNVNCIFPNIVYHPSLIYGTQNSIYWTKYVSPLIKAVNLTQLHLKGTVPWQRKVLELMKEAFLLLSEKKNGYELRVRNHLSEIVLLICENYIIQMTENETDDSMPSVNRLRIMLDYTKNEYMNPIDVAQIAGAASISKRECLRCFQTIIGISPKQYVIELRIQKAKELLTDTTFTLLEICEKCGFQDQSYFTKIFREKAGISPAKWRKKKQIM